MLSFSIGLVGAVVVIVGIIHVVFRFFIRFAVNDNRNERGQNTLDVIRVDLGRYIVLGLEFFIAKDIIETLAVPGWDDIGMLGALVLIRTILSFFLTREIHQSEERKIAHRKIDARMG